MFEKIGELYRHNKGQAVALLLIVCLVIWFCGCESTVASLTRPDKKVTRSGLARELEGTVEALNRQITDLIAEAGDRVAELDRQDNMKKLLADVGITALSGGTVNPAGIAVLAMGIFGIGAVADNRKKDGLITDIQANSGKT